MQLPGELRGDALDAVVTEDQVAEGGQVSHLWRDGRDEVSAQIQELQTKRKGRKRVHVELICFIQSFPVQALKTLWFLIPFLFLN